MGQRSCAMTNTEWEGGRRRRERNDGKSKRYDGSLQWNESDIHVHCMLVILLANVNKAVMLSFEKDCIFRLMEAH